MDYQSPIKNFGEIIQFGELEEDACREIAVTPMGNMGLTYEDPSLVDRIIAASGGRANLIAITCHQILARLEADQRVIREADVRRALNSEKNVDALKAWKNLTGDEQACRLDRIIVYATVEKERFTLGELMSIMESQGLFPEGSMLDDSLERLKLSFTLGRYESGAYFYRIPLFREMIQNDEPDNRLKMDLKDFIKYGSQGGK